jgi:fucose permease
MNWLHACYSLGATLGPLAMTAMVVRLGSWRLGYAAVGAALAAMAALFLATRRRWTDPETAAVPEGPADVPQPAVGIHSALGEPLVRWQILLFFLYGGLEFTVGQWCFTILTESRGVSAELAGLLAGGYYGMIGVGRIAAGAVAHRIGLDRLIRLAMLTVFVGAGLYAFTRLDGIGLLVVGLGLAPTFPVLMTRTPQRLGSEVSKHAVGFQVSAAMLGAALVPGFAGLLAERMGLEAVARFTLPAALLLAGTHEWILYGAVRRASGPRR